MAEPTDDEKRLIEALDDTESANAPLEQDAQRVVAEAREHRDVARELGLYVRSNPQTLEPGLVKQLTTAVQRQNDAARGLRADMREAIVFYSAQSSLTSAVTSSGVSTVFTSVGGASPMFTMPYTQPIPTPQRTQLAAALQAIYDRQELFSKVRHALVALGLDRAGTTLKSPVAFLDDAKANFAHPSGDDTEAIAVLISLRSCINQTLAELMRRRPKQEPASSWKAKMTSLGTHCGRTGLPTGYFDTLADLALTHADLFDGTKQLVVQRPIVMLQINSGLQFLDTLLNGIDKTKLRP
jgi:hypothetical protein